jgi:hypothetical protein
LDDENDQSMSVGESHEEDGTGFVQQLLGVPAANPVRWSELDPAETEQTLVELAEWVCWLAERYQLDGREVPACWWRHGAVVEELTGLWGSWQVAYDDGQSAAAMAYCHLVLNDTRSRLRQWWSRTGCTAPEHRGGAAQPWLDVDNDQWWERFVAGDVLQPEQVVDLPEERRGPSAVVVVADLVVEGQALDAIREIARQRLDLVLHLVDECLRLDLVTRRRAEQIVRSLVKQGEIAAENMERAVEDLLARSEENRKAVTSLVKSESERAVSIALRPSRLCSSN